MRAWTKQDAFDAVWQHFVVNGAPRSANAGGCAYRGDGGARCAVGVLIPDDEYRREFEGGSAHHLHNHFGMFDSAMVPMLARMQRAHDGGGDAPDFAAHMRAALTRIAKLHGLTVPEGAS